MTPARVVMYIGFAFAIIVVAIAGFAALLFLNPNLSLFGAQSVSTRDSSMMYKNSDIDEFLNHRNIIIESQTIDIEIMVRKEFQAAEEAIVIHEDASGISFNSLDRTQIDWMQYIDPISGEVYYKLIILEPRGVIARKGLVEINLYRTDLEHEPEQMQPYNFILNTGESNVIFMADTEPKSLLVGDITIGNATGTITFPTPTDKNPFHVNITGNFTVNSPVNVTCKSRIYGDVTINSSGGTFNFGDIGGFVKIPGHASFSANNIDRGLEVTGQKTNNINVKDVTGNVTYTSATGSLRVNSCDNLIVDTKDASAGVIDKCKELTFTATGSGHVTANQVNGITNIDVNSGAVTLKNVYGGVDIKNESGRTSVQFAETAQSPYINVNGYDGAVYLTNLCGETKVDIRKDGKATIYAEFRKVVGENYLTHNGITRPRSTEGVITVYLVGVVSGFNLTAKATSGAYNHTTYFEGYEFGNGDTQRINGGTSGGQMNFLEVRTSTIMHLYSK